MSNTKTRKLSLVRTPANPLSRKPSLAYVSHDVAKADPISLFFTGKTGDSCSGKSQLMLIQDVVSRTPLRTLRRPSEITGFFARCAT